MVNIRILVLFALFWPAVSEAIEIVFRESHFLGQYRHEIYIKDNQYVYIDDHFKLDNESNWIPSTPKLRALVLDIKAQQNLIEQLIELGVQEWKPEYPESNTPLICDGLSFVLYIKSEKLNTNSSGGCRFPPNYESVRKALEDL
ncbi:hypothetical protein PN836_018655 [Ningiella sp. W23]|uniref:hypothetical protein n=1 Tax=Ningiella sp. W23 TaxID=3023715 RepID=UPI0037580F82